MGHQAQTLEKVMARRDALARKGDETGAASGPAGMSPRVISVTSGKGGVGKTNVTANLAFGLAGKGKRVLVLDADLNLANIDILLGLTPRFNLQHVFSGEKRLIDILVKGPGGVRILPGSSGVLELATLTESQKLFFLTEMETLGQKIDFMLIDTAAGINSNVIYFNLAAQERIIILTPEPTSLTDAYALIKVLSTRHAVKKFRILVNFARSQEDALSVYRQLSAVSDRFLETLSLDFLGYIPYDKKVSEAVRKQRLVTDLFPDSPSGKKFGELSASMTGEVPDIQTDGNIKFFWQGLFNL